MPTSPRQWRSMSRKQNSNGVTQNRRRGRPTKYNPDIHIPVAKGMALLGGNDEQIAAALNIQTSTLYEWKKNYPEFSEALKEGKEVADAKVATSLYKRALGYSFKETAEESKPSAAGAKIAHRTITKHIPPDTTAAIFWLKNRQPHLWRDRKEVEVASMAPAGLDLSKLSDETLRELEAAQEAAEENE